MWFIYPGVEGAGTPKGAMEEATELSREAGRKDCSNMLGRHWQKERGGHWNTSGEGRRESIL